MTRRRIPVPYLSRRLKYRFGVPVTFRQCPHSLRKKSDNIVKRLPVPDRRQLCLIADQNQLCRIALDDFRHKRRINHAGFVHDDRALIQRTRGENVPTVRSEHNVNRCRLDSACLFQTGGGFPGRRAKMDVDIRIQNFDSPDDHLDHGCFPDARAAVDDGEFPRYREPDRLRLRLIRQEIQSLAER